MSRNDAGPTRTGLPPERADDFSRPILGGLADAVRELALQDAREIASRAVQNLRAFADELPEGVLGQVERLHAEPTDERRRTVRVQESAQAALATGGEAVVRDRCQRGVSLLLPYPVEVGSLLRVRLPDGWALAEVRHCREAEHGWLAGCELHGA